MENISAIPRSSGTIDHTEQMDPNMFQDENRPSKNLQGPSMTENVSTVTYCDETIIDDLQTNQMEPISNESFEAMENICEKTASDPNSTLFKYINGDNKVEIVAEAKKRVSGKDCKTPSTKDFKELDEEADLHSSFHQLSVREETRPENVVSVKSVDITQLEEIEAPSNLWDTTFGGNATLQTSPVKMVGLSRPSTIIEEFGEETNYLRDLSSQTNFQSAGVASSHHDTAHDSSDASGAVFTCVKSKHKRVGNLHEQPESGKEFYKSEISFVLDSSVGLINFDEIMAPNDIKSERKSTENPDIFKDSFSDESNSVIEISADLINFDEIMAPSDIKSERKSTENPDIFKDSFSDESSSVIEISSDDNTDIDKNGTTGEGGDLVKVNCSMDTFITNEDLDCATSFLDEEGKEYKFEFSSSGESSPYFNDTLEEVDYMMKKGMQYIKEQRGDNLPTAIEIPAVVKKLKSKQNITCSPKTNEPSEEQQKEMTVCLKAKQLNVSKPKSATKRFAMDIKPIPKLNLFKKPYAPKRLKESNLRQFQHIVSPIGTYMRKTTTAPLLTNFKKRGDLFDATVIRELAKDSQICKPKRNTPLVKVTPTNLPKKAYTSSGLKFVTDERAHIVIPGGKGVQKYIEGAIFPAVLRHEAKVHMPPSSSAVLNDDKKQVDDPSLANLSVMSGDISIYTMKDAQKLQ